jgi:hypothetical protein
VALNYYHPLVHWVAGRLRMQQELAADAVGARHAGGRGGYLVALSRLALRQDGRSLSWPARAFLPARGTLIRRIAMLRDEGRTGMEGRPWSRASRTVATVFLLGVTAAVAMLRGPARGSEDAAPAAARAADAPAPPLYLPERVNGALVIRPALAYRHAAVKRIEPRLEYVFGTNLSEIWTAAAKIMARPGALKLAAEDLEWITAGVRYGHIKQPDGAWTQTVMIGWPAFCTRAPFDWLAFLRQWRLEFTEVREGQAVYYRVKGPLAGALGPDPCVYLPDDRTIVGDGEKEILKLVKDGPLSPAFVRDPGWQRACRGLVALAFNNEGGAFVKSYDVGDPNDAVFLSLFKGVEHWVLSVDDADAIAVRAAACLSAESSKTVASSIDSLVKQSRDFVATAARENPQEANTPTGRMFLKLMTNLRVDHGDRSIDIHADGFGTLADFAAILEAEFQDQAKQANPPSRDQGRTEPRG